ncbi:MAG: toll/interleukin-1 receptor domain-containing protein [Hyphomonadaceae bacterium]|nr:toll/interleukin-1 receptor domain-containing protein [Hyphomonadaceae bacterium]
MADIFISYASEDRARVRPLAEALMTRGFNVWWDRSLAAGQDYTAIIERELKNAKAVIVVWTQSSASSTFVRDEAGRARDDGRLVPVTLDRIDIPLGFGAFQAEDFTRWNGGSNAPQVLLLEEVLNAKLQGRNIDGTAIEKRRRRLGARIRLVSVLTVIALVIGIAAGGRYIFNPPDTEVTQEDLRAELLRLLAEGQLTPEQAITLAQLLEAGALGESQSAALQTPDSAAPSPGAETRTADEPGMVSPASFEADASQAYQAAFIALAAHPASEVRIAVAQMANDGTRQAAMQTLWNYAQANPEDLLREQIYLLCGSVGEANDDPLGQRALEQAANLQPRDPRVWRMLSRSYERVNRDGEARAAAQVSEGVAAQATGDTAAAEQQLQNALPQLNATVAAPVASELGDIAVRREDWTGASARYERAYRLREQSAEAAPNSAAAAEIDADAQQLVIALDRSGRTREACERLQQAQTEHDTAAPDQELLERCQRLRVQLRSDVLLAPQVRDNSQILRPRATP